MQDLAVGTSCWPGFCCYSQGLFWHKRAIRLKPEAGSLLQPHFKGLFTEDSKSRWVGDLGVLFLGSLGRVLWKAFFFCLPGSIAQPSGGYKYIKQVCRPGAHGRSACSSFGLHFLHHLLNSMMDSVIPVKWWDCPSKTSGSHFSMWQNPWGIMTAAVEEVQMIL